MTRGVVRGAAIRVTGGGASEVRLGRPALMVAVLAGSLGPLADITVSEGLTFVLTMELRM